MPEGGFVVPGGEVTMADLTTLTDDQLDVALEREYLDHEKSMRCGDRVESQACHLAIKAILAEQSRRLDEWIRQRA